MVVARYRTGQLLIVDRLREMVRLASGSTSTAELDTRATERALACLRALRSAPARHAGAQRARRRHQHAASRAQAERSWPRAEAALGHPIEIISGIEEARLIYLGVVALHADTTEGSNLVLDIGGGSTELIIGEGYEPK